MADTPLVTQGRVWSMGKEYSIAVDPMPPDAFVPVAVSLASLVAHKHHWPFDSKNIIILTWTRPDL